MRRLVRRIAVATSIVLALSVAVPAGAAPESGGFPLRGLVSWLTEQPVWALSSAFTGVPREPSGPDLGRSGYVSAAATHAGGGAGRAPHKVAGGLDGYTTHQAGTATTATVGAHGFDPKTSRRDATKSTATMDQYVNADGSITRDIHETPVNYRAADGTWKPIDTTLRRDRDGRWQTTANSFEASLASGATAAGDGVQPDAAATDSTGHLVSVTLPTGEVVGYDLQGAAIGAPVVDGSVAAYQSVLPGTDMEIRAIGDGLKETLILNSANASAQWVFPLSLEGLTPRLSSDGAVDLVAANGSVAAEFPHGYMTDSHFDTQTGEMTGSGAISYQLSTVDGQPTLTVTADTAWLNDPARVYPVRVDPSITIQPSADVFLDNDPDTTNTNGDNIAIGTYDGGTTKARGFLRFDNLSSSGVTGKRVTAASLKLYHTWSYDCNHHVSFDVSRVLANWTLRRRPGPTGPVRCSSRLSPTPRRLDSAAAGWAATSNRRVVGWSSFRAASSNPTARR